MRYGEKGKGHNKRKGLILLGLCSLSFVLAVICLVNLSKLRRDLRELDRQLNGGKGEISVTGAVQNVNGAPGSRTVGILPENAGGRESTGQPEAVEVRRSAGQLRELGEDSEMIADILDRRSDYPDKLLEALANNPEMADFVSRWNGLKQTAAGGLTEEEKKQDFPLFLQWDPRWGYVEYGDKSCIGLAGCGPTCLSMVLYYLTGDESITPDLVGNYSMDNGCYISGVGTAWALMEAMPAEYGIYVRQPKASDQEMKAALDDGAVIILSMGPGYFTAAGHFIVVYGYDSEGFMVNDPNCVARSRRQWSYSELEKQIKNMWVFSQGNTVYYYGGADIAESIR